MMNLRVKLLPAFAFAVPLFLGIADPAATQQFSDEEMEAILRGGQIEVGRTRVREARNPQAEPDSQQTASAAASERSAPPENPTAALFNALTGAAAASGAPVGGGAVGGLAKSLMGIAAGAAAPGGTQAGGSPSVPGLGAFQRLGQSMTQSVLDATMDMMGDGFNPMGLPEGMMEEAIQQAGSMLDASVSGPQALDLDAAAGSLGSAQALLDSYNASVAAVATPEVEQPVVEEPEVAEPEAAPFRRPVTRAMPSRPRGADRGDDFEETDDEDDRSLPWARGDDDGARGSISGTSAPTRSRLGGRSAPTRAPSPPARIPSAAEPPAPSTAAPAVARVAESREPVVAEPEAEAAPVRRIPRAAASLESTPRAAADSRFADLPSYEEVVADREGDWFVVLGSYRIRPGNDPLPSPAVDGSPEPSNSASIAGVQERLWDTGHVPYVVRSDVIPGFADGLAVIVLGPMTQREAAAQIPDVRPIVPDAYIKSGW